MTDAVAGERIAKVIARSGLCSRRDAERLIAERRVRIDGAVVEGPALNVTPETRITVDGTPLPAPAPARLWRYHKARGVVTSARDPQGRPTVFERLPPGLPRVISVGRLDISSEGLLLLTNDGALKRRLELPAGGWTRRYRVRVRGKVDPARLAAILPIDGDYLIRHGSLRHDDLPVESSDERRVSHASAASTGRFRTRHPISARRRSGGIRIRAPQLA